MTEETEGKKKKSERVSFWPMIVFVVLVLGLWIGNMFGGLYGFKPDEKLGVWGDRGTFGDMFGAVNALFSGLAFAGLIFTIILQRKDLKLQFSELSRQADETKRTADQFEKQQQLTNYQLIQSTCNNLISIKNKYFESNQYIESYDGVHETIYTGSRAVELTFKNFGTNESYMNNFFTTQVIKQYFKTFFYTLQFINDSEITNEQKKALSDTLNLQTLDSEIKIIYYRYENQQHEFENQQHELALLKAHGFQDRQAALSI